MVSKNIELLSTRAKEWDVRTNSDKAIEIIQKLDEVLDKNPSYLFSVSQEAELLERAINIKTHDEVQTFMNPMFKSTGRLKLCREFDRITEKEYIVPRFSIVDLVFQDSLGSIKMVHVENEGAMVLHQAMDMLDGIYPNDIGLEILPEFDAAPPEEQEELIQLYLNKYLNDMYNILDESLTEDDDTKDKWSALKFMSAQAKGEVNLESEDRPLSNRKKNLINKIAKQLKANSNKLKFWRKNK